MNGLFRECFQCHPANLIADISRFYEILARLERRLDGTRRTAACNKRMDWPRRGVYFFFEEGERRSESGDSPRVVRVGTHALTTTSRASLWDRLSQRRGSTKSGTGNHRGSIFRLIVGIALSWRGDCPLPPTWGVGSDSGVAARKLDLDRMSVKDGEADLKRRVSAYIGDMPFLWLNVDDAAGPNSRRGYIERHSIAMLSNFNGQQIDPPSPSWLGRDCNRARVQRSGLWNSIHVDEDYDHCFLMA